MLLDDRPPAPVYRHTNVITRALLTLGALLPYWNFLTLGVVFIPDDRFASDLFTGELPVRLLVGRAIRGGAIPLWTNQICSGAPLVGLPADPLGLALFSLLPPAPALDLYVLVLIAVAAHGAYGLARRFGVDRIAAVLAGIAFAGSGHIVGQLKHFSILSTIVWLPFGLVLVDRAVAEAAHGARARGARVALWSALLGAVYANQVLSGFPQAAYICALFYAAFALFRAISARREIGSRRAAVALLAALAGALAVGAAAGAIVLLPLSEIAGASERSGPLDYRWATYTSYWPPDSLTFFVPYLTGDPANATYAGPQPFSESYGYAGMLTAILAVYAALRERRRPLVAFLILSSVLSFAFMLGARTPIYYVAHVLIPGMNRFRAPTRFLVVLEIGLVMLAAIGLTRLRAKLERHSTSAPVAAAIAAGVCVVTCADLVIHQPRQNPTVPAREWLAPPATVDVVRAGAALPRTFTPHHRDIHRYVYDSYHGWMNTQPYFRLRDLLEPNTGSYWAVPAADCYVGLPSRWYVAAWGYHYFEASLMSEQAFVEPEKRLFDVKPPFAKLLGMYGVTHVLSPYAAEAPGLTLAGRSANAFVYRVDRTARVRVVGSARRAANEDRAALRMRDPAFDPDREVLLMDGPDVRPPMGTEPPGTARIVSETDSEVVVDADAPAGGYLVLSDSYYPGWRADVDGVPTPIHRANISVRAVSLSAGRHTVRFVYHPSSFFRGMIISLVGLAALVVWAGVAGYRAYV